MKMEKIIRGFGMSNKKPLGYLGGDIMSFGSNLARQYEYDKFNELLSKEVEVQTGIFGEEMEISFTNMGPCTITLEF